MHPRSGHCPDRGRINYARLTNQRVLGEGLPEGFMPPPVGAPDPVVPVGRGGS